MIKVIVDANIILSALVGGEITDILLSPKLEPIAPELLFVEVRKHKEEIKRKSCLSETEFEVLFAILEKRIAVVPALEFIDKFQEAEQLLKGHQKDAPYIALALKLQCPFWTYEKRLQKIKDVNILGIGEIRKLIMTHSNT